MFKKNTVITQEQYDTIYNDTFDNCKEMLNSKGCFDVDIIRKFTDVAVGVALKKSHISYKKEKNNESI